MITIRRRKIRTVACLFRLGALLLLADCTIAFSQTTYQASSATLSGGAHVRPCEYCSGGNAVTGLDADNGGRLTFNHVQAPVAGLYALEIFFVVNDERACVITVNTNTRMEIWCRRTTRRSTVGSNSVLIPLHAGDNVITFENQVEAGPDLDRIVLQTNPVPARAIGGEVNDAGSKPLAGVKVSVTGELEFKTATDAAGRYSFPFVPPGEYYVRPSQPGEFFSPWEARVLASNTDANRQNFINRESSATVRENYVMELGPWRIEYDMFHGMANFFYNGKVVLLDAISAARLPETVTSLDYKNRKAARQTFHDQSGDGVRWTVVSGDDGSDQLTQSFSWHQGQDFITIEMEVKRETPMRCRFIAPLVTRSEAGFLPAGDWRALCVPFDNDKWARYNAVPFGGDLTSYEVSAFYDNRSRKGIVIGSLDHDQWKTGVQSSTSSDAITRLEVFGGVTSPHTRDVLPHGEVGGETIRSPKIFLGCFSDWREGMEAYAEANAKLAPRRPWPGSTPFGWNSWGKIQFNLNYQKAIEVSDFFARELQPHGFQDDGVVYIGLDSGWNAMTDDQLKSFVNHCHANHQEAGIYFTPFTSFRSDGDAPIPNTSYTYKDIYLYANGRPEKIDGGTALDPTHPGTQKLIEANAYKFRDAGFKYVKADFLTHGALEADRHYDPRVTTGMEAYNAGMKCVSDALGTNIFLNLSIAPLFPGQYANSRRIACDAFGDIAKTEYTLNSVTYGWWLSKMYGFSDPDQMVFDGYSEGENRARATSAVVTGLMLAGDDFSVGGSETGKERARRFLTNEEVNALARARKTFRPVEGDTGCAAASLFVCQGEKFVYLAAFNYSSSNLNLSVDFTRIGLNSPGPVEVKELWTGAISAVNDRMQIRLNPTDAALYRIAVGTGR